MLETLHILDVALLNFLREWIITHTWTHPFIGFFADLEPIVFCVFLVWLWLYGVSQKNEWPKHVALDLFWHVLWAFIFYWIINQTLPMRPRPESIATLPPLISHIPDNSFPSGHALFWWASWWGLHTLLKKKAITWIFFWIWLLTVISRILAGIHYPGDILVWFFLGWWLMHIFVSLPHNDIYRKWCHNIPIKIATLFRL